MAGLGRKVFTAGDILAAADVQGYLQDQAVQVYDDTTDRSTTLGTAVSEGMVSYLKDTNSVEVYDGSAWASIATGDITAVTAGTGLTGGGTSGSVTLNVNYAAVGSAVLASPTVTGTAVLPADTSIGNVSATEISYLDGVTSSIQTQLNGAGGLALITSQSFTSSTSVNVNDVFSSTYQNYKVICTWRASGNNTMRLRMRTSGSDFTSNKYFTIGYSYTGTINEGDATSGILGWSDVTGTDGLELNFFRPFSSADDTAYTIVQTGPRSGSFVYGPFMAGGGVRENRSDTGFTIYPDSGNITGTIRVFGIKNS
jgi:hypothetical protein